MELIVQRLKKVWIEYEYYVNNIDEDTIDKAINYDIDCDCGETLYETLEDLGPVKVYDVDWNLLRKNYSDNE